VADAAPRPAPRSGSAGDGPVTTAMSRRGRPRISDEERAERRAELTERAMAAVREGGGDQSLDEIAAHIGVSKPVLYDTFGSRTGLADALALALAERTEAFVVERFGPALPDGTYDVSVERVIELIVTALVFLVDQEPELYTFITSAMRGDRRGMLDNSLVAVVRERIRPVTELATPGRVRPGPRCLPAACTGWGRPPS